MEAAGAARRPVEQREIEPLSARKVFRIIGFAAKQARHAAVERGTSRDICSRYKQTLAIRARGDARPFTLTHVQTACYYLAKALVTCAGKGFDRFPDLRGSRRPSTASRDEASHHGS